MKDQLATEMCAPGVRENLVARAQGWPLHVRLRKLQEECAEAIAAVNRYLENPGAFCREKLAEELCGVANTMANVAEEFAEDVAKVYPRQALKLRGHLERDGL